MFLPWIGVTVHTVKEILWHLQIWKHPHIPSRPNIPPKPSEHDHVEEEPSVEDQKPNSEAPIPSQPAQATQDEKPDRDEQQPHAPPFTKPSEYGQDQGTSETDVQHPQVPSPPQPIVVQPPASRLYALVIGINDYEHTRKLSGAVADADAMVQFLKTSAGALDSRIKNLRDRQATRHNIRENIRLLASCDDVRKDDPILIFYAGHGGEANPPTDWPSGGAGKKIQMLLPCDFVPQTSKSEIGQGIPDITLSILLTQLAKAKGNNITVILDSCNSGSGTRKDFEDPLVVSRGIDLPDNYSILPTLDDDLFPKDIPRATAIAAGFEKSGLASHVLLAGCRATQTSKEDNGRGRFTKALLEVLNSDGTDKMTYEKLVERLPLLPEQDPQCEGIHKSRILFDSMVPIMGRVLHRVTENKAGLFELEAGEAYGITVGAKFNVYAIKDPNSRCLGVLTAKKTTAFTTELRFSPDTSPFTLDSKPGYALQTWIGEKQDLRVSIADDDRLLDVYERTRIEMDKNRLEGKRGILLVEKDQSPDIVLMMQGYNVAFEITDKFCVDRGLVTMPFAVSCDANDVFPVITSAADFYWHLRRTSSDRRLTSKDMVQLECHELEGTDEYTDDLVPILNSKGGNILAQGVINVVADNLASYGFKITNKTNLPLYAALFYFDMSDLSITSYYEPNEAKDGNVDPSIPARGSLTIGYGSGGFPPRTFYLRDDQDFDIGFLKLFVSTKPADFSHIAQPSPFSRDRGSAPPSTPTRLYLWDSLLVGLVQRRSMA